MNLYRKWANWLLTLILAGAAVVDLSAITAPQSVWISWTASRPDGGNIRGNGLGIGYTAIFTANVTGTSDPVTYQWYHNGVLIPGATTSPCSLPVTAQSGGEYTVSASNSAGTVTSVNPATLSVRTGPPPTIVQQPTDQTVVRGDTLTISAKVSGATTYFYEWYRWEPVSVRETYGFVTAPDTGPFTITYTKTNATNSDAGPWHLEVATDNPASESAVSDTIMVAITATPPVITQQPQSVSAPAGNLVTLSVGVTGTPPLTYVWSKDGFNVTDTQHFGSLFAGAGGNGPTLSLVSVPTYAGSYSVRIFNRDGGTVTSNTVTLTMTPELVITSQPQSRGVTPGSSVTFSVTAGKAPGVTAANVNITYQWRKNGVDIPGATAATLSLTNVQPADAAAYSVVASGDWSSVTSDAAVLTVGNTIPSSPSITSQPVAQTTSPGGTATFTVTASGLDPLSYQWRHNSSPIAGATSASLVLTNVQAGDGGNYSVVVSNTHGSVESSAVSLTVQTANAGGGGTTPPAGGGNTPASAPTIGQQPAGQTVLGGHDASFTVVADGNPSPSYQWYFNGQPINGATASGYTVANAQGANAGNYSVTVTNSAGVVTSAIATLAVVQSNFQGVYNGKLGAGGGGGDFALYVRNDGTGVMIVHFSASDTALLLDNISLGGDGSFSAGGTTLAHDRADPAREANGAVAASEVAARDTANVSGAISPSGGLSGSMGGLTFAVQRSGGGSVYAGFYKAPAVNGGSGDAYAIVDGDGHALVFAQTGTRATVGTGVVDGGGQLTVAVADGGLMAAKLDPSGGGLSATVDKGEFSGLAFNGIRDNVTHTDRLANISTRGRTGVGDQVLIAGFIISGNAPRQVLVRAVGPALTDYGVTGTLGNPRFEIYRGSTKIAESNDWGTESDADQVAAKSPTVGAFPLSRAGKDAALLVTLDPGAYTAVVSGVNDTTGVTLVEVYDAGDTQPGTPKLYNISSRGYVGTDDQILIAGIIVGGNAPKRLLVRAVGPTLGTLGVANALSDPVLTIYNGSTVISQNDDWGGDPAHAALSKSLGAFDLPANSKDASLLITLAPGVYTAQVTGKNGTQGIALVEVYDAGD